MDAPAKFAMTYLWLLMMMLIIQYEGVDVLINTAVLLNARLPVDSSTVLS